MATKKDIKENKYGRWLVLNDPGGGRCLCVCDCGTEKTVNKYNLLNGGSKGCGCVKSKPGTVGLYLLHQAYKIRSRRRNIKFSLSLRKFKEITSQNCHYCGTPPSQILRNYYKSKIKSRGTASSDNTAYTYNGIDRVDNNKGYTIRNSVPCCMSCNFAKYKMTQEQFRDLILNIYNHWAKK